MGVGIQVDKLNAWFGKTQALYDINMTVAANHATAVIGPSGCGKSTFVRCLNRMHETVPEARATGRVRIGELDVYNGTSAVQIRRRIGMVFQKANPFPTMSIYDNVAAGLTLNGFHDRKRLDEIVERSLALSALVGRSQGHDEEEIGRQPLRRPAAAPLHRPRHRRRAAGALDGRALFGARSRSPPARSKNLFSSSRKSLPSSS